MPPEDARKYSREMSPNNENVPDSPHAQNPDVPRRIITPTAFRVLEQLNRAVNNPKKKTFFLNEEDVNALRREYGFPPSVSVEEMLEILRSDLARWYESVDKALKYEEDTSIIQKNLGVNGLRTAMEKVAEDPERRIHMTPKARALLLGSDEIPNAITKNGEDSQPSKNPEQKLEDANAEGVSQNNNKTSSLEQLVVEARKAEEEFDERLKKHAQRVEEITKKLSPDINKSAEAENMIPPASSSIIEPKQNVEQDLSGEPMDGPAGKAVADTDKFQKASAISSDVPVFHPNPHTPEEIDAAITKVMKEKFPSEFVQQYPNNPNPQDQQKESAATFGQKTSRAVTDTIPEVRDRIYGVAEIDLPRPGTFIDAGDGKCWVVRAITDEYIRIRAEDGDEQRDVPLAEFAAARRRAKEAERTMEEETRKAVERMAERERFSLGATLERIRYDVSRGVAQSMAASLSGMSKAFSGKSVGRFLEALAKAYEEKAEIESKQLEELEKTRREGSSSGAAYQNIANVASITGNILKYGRILADAVGYTASAPLRWVTLGAVVAREAADMTKEARLTYDEVKEKTRIQDIERAHAEAIALTERALKNKGLTLDDLKNGVSVSAEELQEAYREGLPRDVLERLRREPMPGTGKGIIERMYRTYIGWRAEGLQKKLDAIDAETGDAKEKAAKKRELLLRFGRSKALNDFDRMLGEQGTIDRIAMGADISAMISKAAIYGTMAQSIFLLYDRIAEALSDRGSEVVPVGPTSSLVGKDLVDQSIEPEVLQTPEGRQEISTEFADAHAGWSSIEHAGIAAEHVPLPKYHVEVGDSMYRILRERVPAFRDLGPGKAQEYAMAQFLKHLSPEEVKALGISSGNTQLLSLHDTIDIEALDRLARAEGRFGESIIDQALRRYGVSEPVDVLPVRSESFSIEPSDIRMIVKPIVETSEMRRLAQEAVNEDTLFKYIDGVILKEDFHEDRELWNALATRNAAEFLAAPQTSAEGVLFQRRLASLAQIAETPPAAYERVHDFLERAFREFIGKTGVEPRQEETIEEYLERATERYIQNNPQIFGVSQ